MNGWATCVLERLIGKPSRSSAAAIGHRFVLNGAPAELRGRGVNALCEMMCDWSAAILEMVIQDPTRGCLLRWHTLTRLSEVLERAIARGYPALSRKDCRRLAKQAWADLRRPIGAGQCQASRAAEDLCVHLSQAVEAGYFPDLSDF